MIINNSYWIGVLGFASAYSGGPSLNGELHFHEAFELDNKNSIIYETETKSVVKLAVAVKGRSKLNLFIVKPAKETSVWVITAVLFAFGSDE